MAKADGKPLSRGRTIEEARAAGPRALSKWLYNRAERDAYRSFVALHGPVEGGQKGFRALLKREGMAVPHRYRETSRNPERAEAERKFVEVGLGREGAYTRHRYPEVSDEGLDFGGTQV